MTCLNPALQPSSLPARTGKAGRLEGWKVGGLEGWKEGEGWKAGGGAKAKLPDVLKLGGPKPLLLDLVQMICLSCLNVRVFKNQSRSLPRQGLGAH